MIIRYFFVKALKFRFNFVNLLQNFFFDNQLRIFIFWSLRMLYKVLIRSGMSITNILRLEFIFISIWFVFFILTTKEFWRIIWRKLFLVNIFIKLQFLFSHVDWFWNFELFQKFDVVDKNLMLKCFVKNAVARWITFIS